jgi:serine/threonine protein kinase
MSIAEVQRHFTAYESGEIPEFELRNCLRNAIAQEPELCSAFVALIEAHRRANLIDLDLQSTLNADIEEVTGPRVPMTMIRPRPVGWFVPDPDPSHLTVPEMYASPDLAPREEPESSLGFAANDQSEPSYRHHHTDTGAEPGAPAFSNTGGRGVATSSTTGSSWETDERLTETAAPLYPGSVLRERFVLVEELGRGGMGVVYKAFDRSRGDAKERYVALKILNEDFKRHPLAVRALQREARKAQKLAHPNIATVYDFDRDGGNVYMVMELLSGRSLDQVLREDGQRGIPIVPALSIVKSLAAALSYAHQQGIVHSDFKPSNAFLTRDGKVKVLDFGIARAAPNLVERGEKTTFDAGQLGAISPAYASLEMLTGEEPDVRDDVYALACVTYELLTGTHPYRRIDAEKAHDSGLEPQVIRKLSRTQWRGLRQGLALRRADRCPSVDAFASQLLQRPRQAPLWVAIGAAAAALVALIAAGTWQWYAQRSAPAQERPHPAATASSAPVTQPPLQRDLNDRPPAAEPPSEAAAVTRDEVPVTSAQPEQPVPPERNRPPPAEDLQASEAARRKVEILKEELETKAAAGDTKGTSAAASALTQAAPGSAYVTREVPRILVSSWVNLAKTEFAAGHVDDALNTLKEGRRHFSKSTELMDLESRYVDAGDVYDHLSSAVTINVAETQKSLEALRAQEGDEYEVTAQMLAQTLADRIADQRAAGRGAVADKLLQSGKKLFPNYAALLSRGTAGVLANTPITVDDNVATQAISGDKAGEKPTADRTASENTEKATSGQTVSHDATGETPPQQPGSVKAAADQVSNETGINQQPVSDQSIRGEAANDKSAGTQVSGDKAAEAKATDKNDGQ